MALDLLTIFVTLILLIITLFYAYAKYKLSYWSRRGVKSPPSHLIFGSFKDTFTFKKPPGQVIQEIYDAADPNEPYTGFYVFHAPKLLIRDLNLMKQIFVKDFDEFPNRCFGGDTEKDSLGLINLLSIHQPRWKYLRQKLTPSVTGFKLKSMIPLIDRCSEPMLKYFDNLGSQSDGWKKLEIKEIANRYSTDIIASLAFGIDTNSFNEEKISFYEAGQKILSGVKRGLVIIIMFFLPSFIKFLESHMAGLAEYFRIVFVDSVSSREKNSIKRGDLIDFFISIKNGQQNPDYKFEGDNLLSQAVSFYVAGFEANSTTIAFSLYELSLHPEVEEKLYQEIIEMTTGKELTHDLINEMTFLDQVVNETMRLYPPLPFLDRVPVRDYKIPGTDLTIEKGIPVYISIAGTNRDPKYFEKPDEFIPTRPRIESDDAPNTSLSFGLGPRSCIGQRLGLLLVKIALISILKDYKLSNDIRSETLLYPITVFTKAANGVYIKLKKRD